MSYKSYYGDYIIGTQTAWQVFATKTGFNLQSLMDVARRSTYQVNGNYLWLVEVWDLNFSQLLWCWKNNLYPLKQYQARQLGMKFKDIEDKRGERILTDALAIVEGKEQEAIEWCRVFAPDMSFTLTQAQELQYIATNNIKQKLQALFDAFEQPIIP
jgi:hypothetical protein